MASADQAIGLSSAKLQLLSSLSSKSSPHTTHINFLSLGYFEIVHNFAYERTPMMSLSENEIKAMSAEIQHLSSTKKLLARPALQVMLDLINPSFSTSPVELLREYLARIKAAEGLVKVFHPILII